MLISMNKANTFFSYKSSHWSKQFPVGEISTEKKEGEKQNKHNERLVTKEAPLLQKTSSQTCESGAGPCMASNEKMFL